MDGSTIGVVAKVLVCVIEVNKFEMKWRSKVEFQIHAFKKGCSYLF